MTWLALLNDQIKPTFSKRYSSFFAVFYNKHYIGFPAVQVVTSPSNPKHIEVTRRWANRDRNALWWHVLCSQAAHPKSVVRLWFSRRVRNAFREELKARNMDENCKPMENGTRTEAPALITGYMRLQISTNLTAVKYAQIRRDCGRIIDELLVKSRPQQPGSQSLSNKASAMGNPPGRHLAPYARTLLKLRTKGN